MTVVMVGPHEISVTGHSGYAPISQDIVCAGVSALAQTLILALENLTADKIEYEIRSGDVRICYGNLSEAGMLLVDSFFLGIESISESYPDNVRITMSAKNRTEIFGSGVNHVAAD